MPRTPRRKRRICGEVATVHDLRSDGNLVVEVDGRPVLLVSEANAEKQRHFDHVILVELGLTFDDLFKLAGTRGDFLSAVPRRTGTLFGRPPRWAYRGTTISEAFTVGFIECQDRLQKDDVMILNWARRTAERLGGNAATPSDSVALRP